MRPQARVHGIVHGRVQGVYFRAATQTRAQQWGLTGWVRNCHDGTVEVLAEGDQAGVQRLLDWCRRGPAGARVTRVDVGWETPVGDLASFEIRYG